MALRCSWDWRPGLGIVQDVRGRLPWYKDDWVRAPMGCQGVCSCYLHLLRICTACACVWAAACNGHRCGGHPDVVHVLVSTALAGLVQSLLGGQPLLIIGVAEPIVICYGFLYAFAKTAPGLGAALFLPFAAWVCIWTALMCLLLALSGACGGIDKFTRFSGEFLAVSSPSCSCKSASRALCTSSSRPMKQQRHRLPACRGA
ncbi:HCO3 transporter family-domain-containing protein [Scenedesmus sp. NREL 46B-D3]|nr:HCO3 transporter family-domain-containing protein [Scenedesmus sp. NREL 46B-D3]